MWIALKLFASGALDALLRGLSVAGKWLVSDWRHVIIVALAAFGAFHHFILNPRMNALLEQSEALVTATQLAHLGTIANFIDASAKAERQAQANAARVAAEQEDITDAKLADYRSDLAVLRARFARLRDAGGSDAADRLRARAAAADPRHPDPAGLPQLPSPPGRAAAAPAQDRLPAPGQLSLDDALTASEQAVQLNALIDWVEAQAAVRYNPEPRQ